MCSNRFDSREDDNNRLGKLKEIGAKAYYDQQRDGGKGHQAAVHALAYKWIRIVFRCWKNRVAYDEDLYVRALEKRSSKLAARTELVKQARELRRSRRSRQSVEKLSLNPDLGS